MTESQKARCARYKERHPNANKEAQRRYRLNHLEEIRARDRENKRLISQTPEYKAAKAAYDREYRRKNREKIKAAKQDPEYMRKRREHEKAKCAAYRAEHPLPPPMTIEEKRAKEKIWRDNNVERWKAKNKRWYAENKERALAQKKEYYIKNKEKITKTHNARVRIRMKEDPSFRLRCYLHARIGRILRKNKSSVASKELIGCSVEELRAHLERQFQPGMSWDNYGDWHCDHIYPLSLIDPHNPEQVKAVMNYKNLQPLWGLDNMSKGNRVTDLDKLPEIIISSCIPSPLDPQSPQITD